MKTTRAIWRSTILSVLVAGVAFAGGTPVGADEATSNSPAPAGGEVKADLSEIRARAQTMPIDSRLDIDKRIGTTVERVNAQARGKGQAAVAKRLAAEFATTSDALLEEKSQHGLSWGEMVIAHTLLANSGEKVTFPDLATLRSEGLSWGAIAFGLRFHMEDFEEAIKSEGKVAMGLTKADGKAEPIRK